jgi:hypothetical protein
MSKVEQPPIEPPEPTPIQVAEIVGTLTVYYNKDKSVTLIPDTGKVDRRIQNMLWTLVAPEGVTFADVPIIFAGTINNPSGQPPPPLPDGYTAFTGTVTKWDDVRVSADFENILPHDAAILKYRYDIWINQPKPDDSTQTDLIKIENFYAALDHVHKQLREIDPDMENEPKP